MKKLIFSAMVMLIASISLIDAQGSTPNITGRLSSRQESPAD